MTITGKFVSFAPLRVKCDLNMKKPLAMQGVLGSTAYLELVYMNIGSLWAFFSIFNIELDLLPFF